MVLFRIFKPVAEWRRKRDERLWVDFESVRASAGAFGMRMGDVASIRQEARTGAKKYSK